MAKDIPSTEGARLADWLNEEAENILIFGSLESKSATDRSLAVQFNAISRILKRLADRVDPEGCVELEKLDDLVVDEVMPLVNRILDKEKEYNELFEQGIKEMDAHVENSMNQEKKNPIRIFPGKISPKPEVYARLIELADSVDLSHLVELLNGIRMDCFQCLNEKCVHRNPNAHAKSLRLKIVR